MGRELLMYENRQELEEAIVTLKRLLENDDASENEYQEWFKSHPVIFRALNYKNHVPHPVFPLAEGHSLIPDFLVEKLNGVWEIFELKLPGTRILKDRETRQTFYASLEEFLQQCVDYSKYFNERENRTVFALQTGINIGGRPQAKLVAGRNLGLDRYKILERLGDRGHWVDVITYDDIYAQLEFFKANTFAAYEGLPGFSIHVTLVVRSLRGKDRNQLIMIGAQEDRNCISIYVDLYGNLVFEIVDSYTRVYRSQVKDSQDFFIHNSPTYCTFELGRGRGYSVTSIEVNGRYHSFNILDEFEIDIGHNTLPIVIGSDCRGHRISDFDLYEHLIWPRTLNLDEREALRQNVFSHYFNGGLDSMQRMRFSGRQFLRTNGHANFPMNEQLKASDLVQPEHDKQPLLYSPEIGDSLYVSALYDQANGGAQ